MQRTRIAIVGGGLSGLYAASLLEQAGIDSYVVLEARKGLGGRILSPDASGRADSESDDVYGVDRIDLGPTWFWPTFNGELNRVIQSLDLVAFDQYADGDMVVERSAGAAPMRMSGYADATKSMRLAGGMGALVHALRHRLQPNQIHTGREVRHVRLAGAEVELKGIDESGKSFVLRAEHVLLALPPRLVAERIAFEPALPAQTRYQWSATPTWMAPHAKYVATFDTPFWREAGLSGEARSGAGPMAEIHDASMPGGHAALFGFLGIPASVRRTVSDDVLRMHCRAQLGRLFGSRGATPVADWIKDWAQDPLTATAADLQGTSNHHSPAPSIHPAESPWQGRLTGIASEWSREFPGYVAGAIDAARQGVAAIRL